MWQHILQAPLIGKLLGANLLIALAALAAEAMWGNSGSLTVVCLALAASFTINVILVRLALLPLDELESVARCVSDGDFSSRSRLSPIADRQIARLGDTFNRLLDRVVTDRERIQQLVRQSLRMRETERSTLADELREATAQQLSGLALHLAAAANANKDPAVAATLDVARDIASQMVDEVRLVAESVYPGLLGEFGLQPALEAIARHAAARSPLEVKLDMAECTKPMPLALVTALYRVAEEAVRNAELHAHAGTLWITLACDGREVRLQIEDDGTGFDVVIAERTSDGIGIFRARELLAHAGGELQISSAPGSGTSVVATALLDQGIKP
jgi:signal transduction histidine kinase